MPKQLSVEEEQQLVERALQDADHFQDLYHAYFSRVYGYVVYRLGNTQDIEDVVSEIFTQALRSLHQLEARGEGGFSAWLFGITRHVLVNFYRQQNNQADVLSIDEMSTLASEGNIPEQISQHTERSRLIQRQIATLSPRRQEIIALKFFAGLRNHEIASVLSLDERTVASHLSRALDDLAQKLSAEMLHESR